MHLSGQLSDWSIDDLLQIMQVTKKTGSLDIDGEQRGRVHFREGDVTGAELIGARGSYLGSDRAGVADILYVLSSVASGSFSVGAAEGPDTERWAVKDVLGDVEALRSLEGEIIDAGLFEAAGVRLVEEIDETIAIQPEDWHALVSLVRPFTFDYLETRVGRGAAVRIFHTLHRLGMAHLIAAEDDESGWLDRLAGDVAPGPEEPTPLAPGSGVDTPEGEPTEAAVSPERAIEEAIKGVAAPASTMLTEGIYDDIRRIRGKAPHK